MTGNSKSETPASDVAFSLTVKALQTACGSREMSPVREASGGFQREITDDLASVISAIATCYLSTASAKVGRQCSIEAARQGFSRGWRSAPSHSQILQATSNT
jgi:uncharacterized protein